MNRKYCICYALNDDESATKMFLFSVSTLISTTKLDNIDIVCLTFNNNKIFNSFITDHIKYVDISLLNNMFFNKSHYLKMYIPLVDELKKYSTVLYLDTDTEIMDDISDIFNHDLNGADFIGVDQLFAWGADESKVFINMFGIYPINDYHHGYINTGVCLINIEKISRFSRQYSRYLIECFEKLNNHTKYQNITFGDQRLINTFFKIDSSLPLEYNVFYNAYIDENKHTQIYKDCKPKIFHYTGGTNIKNILFNKINDYLKYEKS